MKKIACLLFCFMPLAISAKHDPKVVRRVLFKYELLLNKEHEPLIQKIIQEIDYTELKYISPRLALCSVKCATPSEKSNRETFIKSIAVIINCLNKIILEQRKFIKNVVVIKGYNSLTEKEKNYFDMIASFYRTRDINKLLERVAPIPVSMAVAQAALESGFGSNKYMNSRNGIFGIMDTHDRLVEFDSVFEAAIAYMKSLNVNSFYKTFRKERNLMLAKSQKISGIRLCKYIGKYSSNVRYRKLLSSIIKEYELTALDVSYKS